MTKYVSLIAIGLLVLFASACNLFASADGPSGTLDPSQSSPSAAAAAQTPQVLADTVFSGYAFIDANSNTVLDESDPPLAGARFTLTGFGEVTDQNGYAMVLIPGEWDQPVTARMEPPVGSGYTVIGASEQTLQNGVKNRADFLFTAANPGPLPAVTPVQIDLTYCKTQDGVKLTMDVYHPKGGNGPYPVVVHVHGGGWTGGDKSDGVGMIFKEELVRHGYLFVSINYRLAPKYKFPAPIEDVKCAIRHLKANAAQYNLDPNRIGALGGSAGGHLAALLGTSDGKSGWDVGEYLDQSSRVQAVVDMYGPADLETLFPSSNRLQSQQIFPAASAEELAVFSPVTYIDSGDPPFLILHGELDQVVPLEQSQIFYERLKAAAVPVEFLVVKNAGHSFVPEGGDIDPSLPELSQIVADFFDQHLK